MPQYICPRCHYDTKRKNDLVKHYNRKKKCKMLFSRKSIKDCIDELDNFKKKTYEELEAELTELNENIEKEIEKECDKKLQEKLEKQNEIPDIEINQFIYLLQEREFIKSNSPIYKIGKTKNHKCRMSKYPKGSYLIILMPCDNSDEKEKELLNIFNEKFIQRKDIGTEYFQGNIKDMISKVIYYCNKESLTL